MLDGSVPLLLAALPLAVWFMVMVRPGLTVSTRTVPAEVLWKLVPVVFVAWVSPWWGICAALAAWHWLKRGWQLVDGAWVWPVCAMAAVIGTHAPRIWLDGAIVLALAMGVLEVVVATAQYFRFPLLLVLRPDGKPEVFGTLGHRTGLGAYLALLVPLGFLTSWGMELAAVYAVGLFLSRSNVAVAAGLIGFLFVAPGVWWMAFPAAVVGFAYRSVKFRTTEPGLKWRHMADTWTARMTVWRATAQHMRWKPFPPTWLVGHGVYSFALDCRTWTAPDDPLKPCMYATGEIFREAHNDFVEHAYEYGALGCLAMVGWVWSLRAGFGWHDPLTGAALALGVTMLGSFPLRVAPILGVVGLVVILLIRRVM